MPYPTWSDAFRASAHELRVVTIGVLTTCREWDSCLCGSWWTLSSGWEKLAPAGQGAALSELTLETFTVLCWGEGLPGLGAGDAEGDHPV